MIKNRIGTKNHFIKFTFPYKLRISYRFFGLYGKEDGIFWNIFLVFYTYLKYWVTH